MRYRIFQVLASSINKVVGAAVRAIFTTLVFGVCVAGILHFMGVPLPSAHDLINGFEGLSKLARIL